MTGKSRCIQAPKISASITPAQRFQGASGCGLYGDFIHELDWIVGELMSCLEDNGLCDDTLVIFTSDNGGMFNFGGQAAFKAGYRQNGDLLGFKFGVWEGGHRVPMIVRWPGRVEEGSVSDQLIGNVDMLATFAALTGQELDKTQHKQGSYYLTTLESSPEAARGMDSQTGVIVSPLLIVDGGEITFRIGGGRGQSTYAALCTADGKEAKFARGINDPVMQIASWDLTAYAGKKMFIKIVDASTTGWGHMTVDDFQFDATILSEYPSLGR